MNRCEFPFLAAVMSEGEIRPVPVRMLVVSTGDHAVKRIAEGDGEDACGLGTMSDGSIENRPGFSAIGRVEHASATASGGEPEIGIVGGSVGGFGFGAGSRGSIKQPSVR